MQSHHEAAQDALTLPHELSLLQPDLGIHPNQGRLLPGAERQIVLRRAAELMHGVLPGLVSRPASVMQRRLVLCMAG